MEDTKKTVLAGNGEKDVPRAVYDGVLTIDVDAQVESMEEQEEARWHQLLNAHRTRKILTGQLGGIEKLESGWMVAVTYFNGFRIIFLLDEEEQERDVFCVRSFGFDNQGFMEFYRKLRWIVPGRTRIIGTKTQEVWKLRRPNIGICTAAGMLLGYVLPKLLEMMYG